MVNPAVRYQLEQSDLVKTFHQFIRERRRWGAKRLAKRLIRRHILTPRIGSPVSEKPVKKRTQDVVRWISP